MCRHKQPLLLQDLKALMARLAGQRVPALKDLLFARISTYLLSNSADCRTVAA